MKLIFITFYHYYQFQALTLHAHRDWHSLTFFAKQTKSGFLFQSFGTPGWGQNLAESQEEDTLGKVLKDSISKSFKTGNLTKPFFLTFY